MLAAAGLAARPDRPGAARAAAGRGARLELGTAPGPDRGRHRDAGPGRARRHGDRLHPRHRGSGGSRGDRPAVQPAAPGKRGSSSSPGRCPATSLGGCRCCTPAHRSWSASSTASSARTRRTLSLPQEPLVASRVVAPRRAAIGWLPLPRRLQGLTGSHESARAGDGGDFRDVHPFTAGDRLRRIDWKATARRGQNAGRPLRPPDGCAGRRDRADRARQPRRRR